MTWLKVDDGFYDHPKVDDTPLSAVGLWTRCGSYTSKHLKDGHIATTIVRRMGGRPRDVDALVGAGLWLPAPGGFVMHDFHDWNPTAAQVRARRARWAERQQKRRLDQLALWDEGDDVTP